ncbi:MAG: type III pantothenate kinase [Candidatus Omnitrophica bacterium]|nr:type III pantothenate kinase [Candidatus Omnitrophota bacterium]MDD5592630.1 type III pantothenate kinase [Candidatus Omnitrophota bacterium]
MLLAIDIGNTNITCGIFRGDRILKRFTIPTQDYGLEKIRKLLGRIDIRASIICSVVPRMTGILAQGLKKLMGKRPYIIGKDVKVPIENLYRNPKQVGQDRLVNAYAGVILYGAPLVVVDFGTAVTFDIISGKKEYLGGMILPGLKISLDALAERTALLPKISLRAPKEFIGRDTKNSIRSGLVYGFASLTDELVARIRKKIGRKAKVIGTGGDINLISGYCKRIDKIDRDLTLKGLNFIAQGII